MLQSAGSDIELDDLPPRQSSYKTGKKHPLRIFPVDALCDRVTVLAHNFLCERPASIRKFLRPFILGLSSRLQPHKMVLIGVHISKPVPKHL